MSQSKRYTVKAVIEHRGNRVLIELEGSGFTGKAEAYSISVAFDSAYQDLMAKVGEAIFTEEKV